MISSEEISPPRWRAKKSAGSAQARRPATRIPRSSQRPMSARSSPKA